ncbi:MAG: glycoside hydrolase family 3 N-terminal domain-containing protein [Bacteroidota bacterium]
MKLTYSSAFLVSLLFFVSCGQGPKKVDTLDTDILKRKVGQMLMVGFRGTSVAENDAIHKVIKDYHLGGVVLYNRDLPSKEKMGRNITSKEQLVQLNQQLQSIDSVKLWIAIDEEGGFVTRLSPENGFLGHKSHQAIGQIHKSDSTKIWANTMASELKELGINMNFGPVVDVNINPKNPIIGGRERSFSDSIPTIIEHSSIFMEEHKKLGILCVPKHFPGHGSSTSDSHKGFTDVTHTWSEKELIPFKQLIQNGKAHVMMTSHVYNAHLDTLPSTLSPKIINKTLRGELGFDGVLISDDMQMRAISNFYNFEEALEKAILAGVDVLLISNNAAPCQHDVDDCTEIPFDPNIAKKAIDHIMILVEEGKISESRIEESYQRIMKLKNQS